MGGLGSTRWGNARVKRQADGCFMICAPRSTSPLFETSRGFFFWKRYGLSIIYELKQDPFDEASRTLELKRNLFFLRQLIEMQSTRPAFGGLRWWFLCPSCYRRSGKLYAPGQYSLFKCRVCYDLSYESAQNAGAFYYRIFQLRARELKSSVHHAREEMRAGGNTVESLTGQPVPLPD